ncbi:hypothetical protein [Crocosphaera sp. XPORK-15E]|uniref:hypothetical protein n=1 Tax=Crocosphaera sp. XPORK-15E TaxID=3110247 RepID=UPI002B1F8943|nr:hypothetical protein [Crocosphaera sp. XPORK-15E]MEA5536454.1 hypothetical protein [Crocosphaera sp. XPORK-15E]
MEINLLDKRKKIITYILFICLEIYFFLVFLPLPESIRLGLDPSWQYAISQAAEDGLIWGKDIVFTYGPFGYLIDGVALENNVIFITAFRLIVHLALFITFTIKIISLDSLSNKVWLTSGFFLAFWLGRGLGTDYKILFILLLILSFDNILQKHLRWVALTLGALSGFCLLTKFSLGIVTLGSLTLFLLGNIYQSLKSNTEIKRSIFALLDALFAAISVAFILLYPSSFFGRFGQIIFFLVCSGGAAILLILGQKKNRNISLFLQNNLTTEIKPISWIVFYIVYGILLFSNILHSDPSLIDYSKTSLQISSGFSSAMSLYVPRFTFHITLHTALLGYFLSLFILILLAKEGSLSFALAVFFSLFISFKHGFIRQDGHVFYFSTVTLFVIPLCLTKIKTIRIKQYVSLFFIYILVMALVFNIFVRVRNVKDISVGNVALPIFQRLAPSYAINNLSSLLNFNDFSSNLIEVSKNNLQGVKLSENVTNLVKNKSVDIIPWEISLVPANNLNWKPRPIFQSYSAYTEKLDNINFESFSKEPRDYIFYSFLAIDGRHPFFDEPKTFSYVFCNYKPSSQISDFVNTPQLSNIILLEKSENRCFLDAPNSDKNISLPWNTFLSLDAANNVIIKANVDIKYSLLGKLIKSIFRVPPVTIVITHKDGSTQQYRIIPENSNNGVIVSHLPRKKNHQEVLSFFKGELLPQVDSFSFQNRNSLLYKPTINITLSSVYVEQE